MSFLRSSGTRKRKRSCCESATDFDLGEVVDKRPRLQQEEQTPLTWLADKETRRRRYWNTLSKVPVTRRALKEFDRRHREQSTSSKRRKLGRQRERKIVRTIYPNKAEQDLSQAAVHKSQRIKRFARGGGPDLTDLRGVRSACTNRETMKLTCGASSARLHRARIRPRTG